VVFSDSKRLISPDRAREIFSSVGPFITRVCVSHTTSEEEWKKILAIGPDVVQISHPFVIPKSAGVRVIRVIQLCSPIPEDADAIIVDASRGTGLVYDEEFFRDIQSRTKIPVILAGGLTPDTVAETVRQLRPYAVDVASGVESAPGIKDHALIQAFVKNAQEIL